MKRQMGNLLVEQRTSDGMFNSSMLLSQWNKIYGMKKYINDFFNLKQTDAFINELMNGEIVHTEKSLQGDSQAFTTKKGKYTIHGREPDETWMHPYLFLKFAMWMLRFM